MGIDIVLPVAVGKEFVDTADLGGEDDHLLGTTNDNRPQFLGVTTGKERAVGHDADNGVGTVDLKVGERLTDGEEDIAVRATGELLKWERGDDMFIVVEWPTKDAVDVVHGIQKALRIRLKTDIAVMQLSLKLFILLIKGIFTIKGSLNLFANVPLK